MPNDDRIPHRFLFPALLIAGLFLVVRGILLHQISSTPLARFPILDSEFYYAWAMRLASGNGHPPGAFWLSPLYPVFLALLFKASGSVSIVLVFAVQCLLSFGTLLIIGHITRVLFGWPAAIVAGLLATLYAPWLYYDGTLLSASLILFLNALILLLVLTRTGLVSAVPPSATTWKEDAIWLAIGALCGLSALARPSVLLFAAGLLGWLLLQKAAGRARRMLFFAAAIAVVLLPVLIRNQQVAGSFVLTTASGGVNFFIGNRAGASGMYDELDFIESFDPKREAEGYRAEAEKRTGRKLSLNQASRYWGLQALDDIVHAPLGWVRLLVKKLWLTLQREELPTNLSFRGVAGFVPIVGALPLRWGLLFPLAAAGFYFSARKRRDLKLCFLYAAAYVFTCLLFFSASEYRFPMILVLLPAAGNFFVELWRVLKEKDHARLLKGLGVYVAALAIANTPSREVALAVKPHMDYYNMATVASNRGLILEAMPLYTRALAVYPGFTAARLGLAKSLWTLGSFDDAREEYALAGVAPPDSIMGTPLQEFLEELYQYTEDNEYERALAFLDSFFPVTRDAPRDIWVNRAMVEIELRHYDRAIEAILKAAEKEKDSPHWPYHAGRLALLLGDSTRADSFFQAAVKLYPPYAPARIAIGRLALARGDSAEARRQLDELRQIRIPDDSVKLDFQKFTIEVTGRYDPNP